MAAADLDGLAVREDEAWLGQTGVGEARGECQQGRDHDTIVLSALQFGSVLAGYPPEANLSVDKSVDNATGRASIAVAIWTARD
jgi:hypothetical protein